MLCSGLFSRIFQHEIDHLNGRLMWDEEPVDKEATPRRIEQRQLIDEISEPEALEKFYNENRRFIFDD